MKIEFPEKLQFLFEPCRYKICYGGRGGTKSWGIARALLILGIQKKIRVLCARETMKSLTDSVHKLIGDQIEEMGLSNRYKVQQSEILGTNGTEFVFAGLKQNINNLKSFEGCDYVWVEEAATVSKRSWEVLIPTIRKEQSEIWVSFNPELETDDTYMRFIVNPPAHAKVVNLSWRDNPWLPDVLRVEKDDLKQRDPISYEHVWEGACRSSVEGAIYGEEIKTATIDGRICSVPYDRTKPVDTVWDLGFEDKTAIWFVQAYGGWYNFIDYLQDERETIHHYLIQLQQRGYVYGTDFLPHDGLDTIIHKKLSGAGGHAALSSPRSIEMIFREQGRNVRLVPKIVVTDGINAARTMFSQCRFDENKCYEGIRALRMYQWGPPSPSGKLKREPLHDAASHGADGFRYAAWAVKQPRKVAKEPEPEFHPASAWS